MSLNDRSYPETQTSRQPKRAFPWDYTTHGRRPNSEPELKAYNPRNSYRQPSEDSRPRELAFSMDNSAFYEPSPYTRSQINSDTADGRRTNSEPKRKFYNPTNSYRQPSEDSRPRERAFSMNNPAFHEPSTYTRNRINSDTTDGRQPNSKVELKAYNPRNRYHQPSEDSRPRELAFSMDNPAFYEPSPYTRSQINSDTTNGRQPNSKVELKAYNPRNRYQPPSENTRPREVTFSMDDPTFYEPSPNSYGPPNKFTNFEHGLTSKHPSRSPKEDESEKKSDKRCCSYCDLVVIIIILLVLLLAMTSLFIWRMICCSEEDKRPFPTTTPIPCSKSTGCRTNPNPILFTTLPQRIQENLDQLNSFVEEQVGKQQAAAISINIVYGDKVIWERGFGVLNKAVQPPRTPSSRTLYPCASVSKVLTALILFKLVNDKRVQSLDDQVVRYEANFAVKNPFNDQKITLRELAAQRSGLQREAPCYPILKGSNNLCPYDYNTMLNRIKNLTLLRSPGTKPQYSNLGYGLLGRVLHKSFSPSGLNFDQWMNNDIFSKLGMGISTFSPSESQKSNMPVGYLDGDYINPIYDWGWLQPSGGLFSSVSDLSKLLIELMTSKATSRFLSLPLTEELFKPDYIFLSDKSMTGMPWEMKSHDGYIIREKSGYIYGYNSYVAMVPEIRLGITFLCTDCQQKLSSSIPVQFMKILSLFKEEFARDSIKNFTMPPDPKPFLGQFNSTIPTIKRIDVKKQIGHLTLAVNGFDLFFLNFTAPLTFKISINPAIDCFNAFVFGVENDVVEFDKPSSSDGRSPGLVMFGANAEGRSYFPRID